MLWQKSEQYAKMPHEQYMQTDEGKRSVEASNQYAEWTRSFMPQATQQATAGTNVAKAPDMTAYKPGTASPKPTASQGTPYGAYGVSGQQGPRPSNTAFVDAYNQAAAAGPKPTRYTPAYSTTEQGRNYSQQLGMDGVTPVGKPVERGVGNEGNYAYMPDGYRPPPFQAQYQNIDGSLSGQPAVNDRDALINRLNQNLTPYITGERSGPPQYDIPQLFGQAKEDVAAGWQNPFNFNQPQGQGTPPGRDRSRQEIGGDFYDPDPGGIKPMVVSEFYNPQTGEEYSGTGIVPREGTGWVAGKSPLAALKTELAQAERDAAYPPRRWDDATRTVVEGPPGAAEKYAQRAENLRRQIAEMENSGPAGTAQPPSVFRDGDRITKRPGYRPGTAQPTQPQGTGQPSSPGVQGRPDNRMAIQDLFTKNNVQAPQGFLDQLIGLLGGSAPQSQMPPRPDGAALAPRAADTGMASPQVPPGEAKKFRYSFNGVHVEDIPATAAALEERTLQSMSVPLAAGNRYGGGRDSMNKFIDAAEASGVYAAGDIGRMRKLAAAQPSYQEMIDRDAAASWKRKQAEKKSRERPGDHTITLSDGSQVTVDAKGRPIDSPTGGMYVGKSWMANIQR